MQWEKHTTDRLQQKGFIYFLFSMFLSPKNVFKRESSEGEVWRNEEKKAEIREVEKWNIMNNYKIWGKGKNVIQRICHISGETLSHSFHRKPVLDGAL